MTGNQIKSLVIAIDYYDGEAEGFCRFGSECFYFRRSSDGVDTGLENYACVPIESSLFERVSFFSGADGQSKDVFVYPGGSNGLDAMLDQLLPSLRQRLDTERVEVNGFSVLDALAADRAE